jgi:hypothetical protein
MCKKYYTISEDDLRNFLDEHAQSMRLEDDEAAVLRSQPSEKGVWVTRQTLMRAF